MEKLPHREIHYVGVRKVHGPDFGSLSSEEIKNIVKNHFSMGGHFLQDVFFFFFKLFIQKIPENNHKTVILQK